MLWMFSIVVSIETVHLHSGLYATNILI